MMSDVKAFGARCALPLLRYSVASARTKRQRLSSRGYAVTIAPPPP